VEEREIDIIKTQSYIAVFFITIIYIYTHPFSYFSVVIARKRTSKRRQQQHLYKRRRRRRRGIHKLYCNFFLLYYKIQYM